MRHQCCWRQKDRIYLKEVGGVKDKGGPDTAAAPVLVDKYKVGDHVTRVSTLMDAPIRQDLLRRVDHLANDPEVVGDAIVLEDPESTKLKLQNSMPGPSDHR